MENLFCLAFDTVVVNLQTFAMIKCKTICYNYILYLMHKEFFILVIGYKKKKDQIFSFFPIVKIVECGAEICRVGTLKAGFQQISLIQ